MLSSRITHPTYSLLPRGAMMGIRMTGDWGGGGVRTGAAQLSLSLFLSLSTFLSFASKLRDVCLDSTTEWD